MKRAIAILVFDEVEVLDWAGPFEVFTAADELQEGAAFTTFTVGETAAPVRCHQGLRLVPDYTLATCPTPQVLVIPGGCGTRALIQKPGYIEWVRCRATEAEIVLSVCTGALVLGRAGLLDGLRATTHPEGVELLRALSPHIRIDRGARYHDNGKIITAAGVSAGIDAALHVVGRLLGEEAAAQTARYIEYERRAP